MIEVEDAKYLKDYVIWLRFNDGSQGEVDLEDELAGEVFEPLNDPEFFKNFTLNPEWKTIAWPNGADFAPEFLYSLLRVHA
ncbi:MAG: hypothetical protein QOF62_1514 [Pyrinomonadaceae bacterium]|jgi:hypothetical protein|nr:hypothetical protein [Pyrinomonadaceae bacterium]